MPTDPNAIEPGSIPYGERQTLEAGLSEISASAAPTGGPAQAAAVAPMPIPEDPIGALISGSVDPGASNSPITSGLSVGSGPGPAAVPADPMMGGKAAQLRLLAQNAASPTVRAAARRQLRRMERSR